MKNYLLISYVFPPTGGVGAQRALKFAKYSPEFGWRPVVLTPDQASSSLRDPGLLADLPPDLIVERLPSLEPASSGEISTSLRPADLPPLARLKALAAGLLFPDRHVLWLPTALPGALAAARRRQARAVMVTAPPFSTFLLGLAVARLAGLPLVLDFRDDWSGFYTKGFAARGGGELWRRLVLACERICVRTAARVIGNTPEMTARLARLHGGPAAKYVWVPNGYDPEDYADLARQPAPDPRGRLRLTYAGTVFAARPLGELWAGLARLSPAQRARLAVTVMGRVLPGEVADPGLEGLEVEVLPFAPHQEALRRMAASDVLLLTVADLPGLASMVPAKLYEYLAVGRPILAIAPWGEAARLIAATEAGSVVPPGQPEALAKVLADWLERPPRPAGPPPAVFQRRRLSALLARTLDQAVSERSQPWWS